MRVLVDTDVVIDLMLDREPFSEPAAVLCSLVEAGHLGGMLAATTIATLHHLASKTIGRQKAKAEINKLLALFRIAAIDRAVLVQAVQLDWPDFEGAVLHEAALQNDAQAIVTRDPKGFKRARIAVLAPDECIRIVLAQAPEEGLTS